MQLTLAAFKLFQQLVYKESGIYLPETKLQMVSARLMKKLRQFNLSTYEQYYDAVLKNGSELQEMIDIITTNETSFFREPAHFDYLKSEILPHFSGVKFRAWSAAASIGAEAYTIAITLDEALKPRNINFEIVGTDINTEVIQKAKSGVYPIEFAKKIDSKLLKKYCLEGYNAKSGFFMIDDYLRSKCEFTNANLMNSPPSSLGMFDVIFLRNMLIYFDGPNKKTIVENVVQNLKSGGYLFIGHSESISNITNSVRQVKPTIYKKD